jgi:hypothetical protein
MFYILDYFYFLSKHSNFIYTFIAIAYVLQKKICQCKHILRKIKWFIFRITFIYCRNIQSELLQVHNLIAIAYVLTMKFSQCKHNLRQKKVIAFT